MNRRIFIALVCILTIFSLVACGNGGKESKGNKIKVGLVTNTGVLEDKSFSQGSWEGVQKAVKDLKVDSKYLLPTGTTEAEYLKEIGNLYDAGYKFIVTPGFKFESAIYKAQDKYTDAKFVLIDGQPTSSDGKSEIKDNTVAIFYADEQAGFIAGVAASVELKEGGLGFIGGMEIPPVQRFCWGFQQGIAYANKNLGTKLKIDKDNIVYEGSFDNIAGGQQIAAQMYNKGVKAIFCAAGSVGIGAINEAKIRTKKGEPVWVIGVDVDQYDDGKYDGEKSVILTSATKKIGKSVYDMIKDEQDGRFKGGEKLIFDASVEGIGLPEKNPNLSKETIDSVNKVYEQLKSGEIKVHSDKGNLPK